MGETPFKISFCSTCKNRLWQLSQTFAPNLSAVQADGNSELVLVNYNSQDGLDEWIRQFGSAIEAGTFRYVHERSEPHFHTTKAKNLAHFAATGEYVVNLDGDNFIGDTIPRWRRFWRKHPDLVILGWCGTNGDGTYGRVGMAKRHFLALGGYDEQMLPGPIDDIDLLRRAEARNLRVINLAQLGLAAIKNDKTEQIRYSAKKLPHEVVRQRNIERSTESIELGRLVANPNRKQRAVLINFSNEVLL